jgi:hypothetical protein
MSNVSVRLYNEAMMLDNFTCVYCGKQDPELTIDHLVARSVGGADLIQNLVACCQPCNSRKKDRALYEANMIPAYGRFDYVREQLTQIVTTQGDYGLLRVLARQMRRDGFDNRAIADALYERIIGRPNNVDALKATELFMQGKSPADIVRELRGIRSNQGGAYQRALDEVLELIREGMARRPNPQPTPTHEEV